jgi:hypothetical protein
MVILYYGFCICQERDFHNPFPNWLVQYGVAAVIACALLNEFDAGMNGAGLPHPKLFLCFVEDANVKLIDAREGLGEPNLATGEEGLLDSQNAEHSNWLMDSDFFHHGVNIPQP